MPPTPKAASPLWRVLRTLALAYVVVLVLAYVFQRRLQYMPHPFQPPLPTEREYAGLEEFATDTSDGERIQGWYWPGDRPLSILLFHGNAGNRSHRLEWMRDLHSLGVGVCMPDYRSYGGSTGSPSETGFALDAEATLRWLEARAPGAAVVFLGESIGSGVAVELGRRHPPKALILQGGFSSAADVGQRAYPFLPVRWLLRDRYDNLSKIAEVKVPLLMIHGTEDEIVPLALARRLWEAAGEPKEWFEVEGSGHNDLVEAAGPAYLQRLRAFLARHAGL